MGKYRVCLSKTMEYHKCVELDTSTEDLAKSEALEDAREGEHDGWVLIDSCVDTWIDRVEVIDVSPEHWTWDK